MSTPETARDQIARVELMATDSGDTWDLSLNDQAALRTVLRQRADLLAACRLVLGHLDGSTGEIDAVALLQTAIAKAEGKGQAA